MQPFYLIPLLVEQPTWGGNYIARFKSITQNEVSNKKIGQAFELYNNSSVTQKYQPQMPFAFATTTDIDHPSFFHQPEDVQTLQSVIDKDPVGFLGQRSVKQYGNSMQVLIKFTQALNNSYQAHVKVGQEFGKWQAKPESWYYLEKGKATLGLNPAENVSEYQQRCQIIDMKAQELSQKVLSKELDVETARQQLKDFINQDHPRRFVNTILIEANQVIDLSAGGTHHSWEMGEEIPQGNIVYEVQKNVMDEFCTLRSFDQGNIKDDGKVRTITIDDYFKALDTDPKVNQPKHYLKAPIRLQEGSCVITELFNNVFYKTLALSWSGEYSGQHTQTNDSFHHLFVEKGSASVTVDGMKWKLDKGMSLIIPAAARSYQLYANEEATILQTSV